MIEESELPAHLLQESSGNAKSVNSQKNGEARTSPFSRPVSVAGIVCPPAHRRSGPKSEIEIRNH
jgi:hypothetical protein